MAIKEEAATLPVLGVDVSKERLDAALLKEGGEFAGRAKRHSRRASSVSVLLRRWRDLQKLDVRSAHTCPPDGDL